MGLMGLGGKGLNGTFKTRSNGVLMGLGGKGLNRALKTGRKWVSRVVRYRVKTTVR